MSRCALKRGPWRIAECRAEIRFTPQDGQMMGGQHVISYSGADARDFALVLCDRLEAGPPHVPVWLDQRDIPPGREWGSEIDKAIETCVSLLFVMSKDSIEEKSRCTNEWSRAVRLTKPVVPLLLHRDARRPLGLENHQHIDFSEWRDQREFDQALAKLRNHLNWLESPAGVLRTLEDRLADAKREMRRATGSEEQAHIRDDIVQLEQQIKAQGLSQAVHIPSENIAADVRPSAVTSYPKIFQAPGLPNHYVDRAEVSVGIKAHLMGDEPTQPGILVISAIHGMGGIGKSTTAMAVAHDPEVRARFADGVLWVHLGQRPDLLSGLSLLVQALGDANFQPLSVDTASAYLRTLLQPKKALIVIDDACAPDHLRPFLVGGPDCRTLITTREALVAEAVHAGRCDLDVMTPEQSISLLAKRLGRPLTRTERAEALGLVEAVDYLPLALELVAAQLADGIPCNELLRGLKGEVARLEKLERPTIEDVNDEVSRKSLSLISSFAALAFGDSLMTNATPSPGSGS